MAVTRAEEWCVEAETAEEARERLAAGFGELPSRSGKAHRADRLTVDTSDARVAITPAGAL